MRIARHVLFFAFTLACAAAFGAGITEAPPAKPRVSYLEGDVTVDGSAAVIGDPVPLGSTVRTAAESACEIQFDSRNIIRMAEGTVLVFDPRNLQTGSQLREGALILVLKKLAAISGGPAFIVRTGNTAAGVRGTSFFVKAVDESTTYVCCCNGAIHVEGDGGQAVKDIEASHHSAVLIRGAGGTVTMEAAALEYHGDADMEQAAAKIGVTIDWSAVGR